jgi:fibro-slime domain-containing protein
MRRVAGILVVGLMVAGMVLGYGIAPASAVSFTGTYFEIANPGATGAGNVGGNTQNTSALVNPVCGRFTCFGAVAGSVAGTLSGTGQPVAAGGFWTEANGSPILLWTAGNNPGGNVTPDKVQADAFFTGAGGSTTSLAGTQFFATGQTTNANFYRSVHWNGLFSAPGGATFTVNADDHAFLYVNGQLVVDAGGIKALSQGTFTGSIAPSVGPLTFDLFFADVFRIDSGLSVSCEGCVDPTAAVPEPTSLLLFGTTLAGLGTVLRRKFRRQQTAA